MTNFRIFIRMDDEATTAALVVGKGRQSRISWAGVVRDAQPQELVEYVRKSTAVAAPNKAEVLLMVSDRRIITGRMERKGAPARRDIPETLRQEAQAKGMFADDEDLAIGYHATRVRDEWRAYYEAAPEQTYVPYVRALQDGGYAKIKVVSTANVLAQGIATTNEVVGIVDTRGSAAYFVLAHGKQTLAMRKILLAAPIEMLVGEEQSVEALLPLGAELARSVEFFTDKGLPRPGKIIFTVAKARDLDLPAFFADMVEIPCEACDSAALSILPTKLADRHLGWSSYAFAATSLDARTTPFLADVHPVRTVRGGRGAILPIAGVAATLAGVAVGFVALQPENRQRRSRYATQKRELTSVRQELEAERSARAIPGIVIARSNILKELAAARVSMSRVGAILGNERPDGLRLRSLRLKNDRLVLEGMIQDEDGLGAVASFSMLDQRLRRIPGLSNGSGKIDSESDSDESGGRSDTQARATQPGLHFTYRIDVGAKP